MKVFRITFSLVFSLVVGLALAKEASSLPGPAKPGERPALCKPESLPSGIRNRLKDEFSAWRVQEPADLSRRAYERWESEKPSACPGIAVGRFESARAPSYAVLLVRAGRADTGYRFLVFSPKTSPPSYNMRLVEQSDDGGAANFFIHGIRISKFFDQQSRRKFQVRAREGILLVDSAETEYEADVYFWVDGSYKHQPVDY